MGLTFRFSLSGSCLSIIAWPEKLANGDGRDAYRRYFNAQPVITSNRFSSLL
jgi:hypothetical protein